MGKIKFSVIIPLYNQEKYIGETIESVLNQTYTDFELIVVNDGSTDNSNDIVMQFNDPRVQYFELERNMGEQFARNAGIRASKGNVIAHLDADDLFHPQKLEVHSKFLTEHPEIGLSYNPRYNLHHSSDAIRDLWRPPDEVSLSDLVLGYPFAPSDVVVRKEWIIKVGYFDESYSFSGEELDMNCRLALEGCKFASVDKTLNYRRYHTGRRDKNLIGRETDINRALDTVFNDPRCPPEVSALRDQALSGFLLVYFFIAFAQQDYDLGKNFLRKALALNPSIIESSPIGLINFLVKNSIRDNNIDHSILLHEIFTHLPENLSSLSTWSDWAISQGYLLKGANAVIWNDYENSKHFFSQAAQRKAIIEKEYLIKISSDIQSFAKEHGKEKAQAVLNKLLPLIEMVGDRSDTRYLVSHYAMNRAFQSYKAEDYPAVPAHVFKAFFNNPVTLGNRGLYSVLFRSLAHSYTKTDPNNVN